MNRPAIYKPRLRWTGSTWTAASLLQALSRPVPEAIRTALDMLDALRSTMSERTYFRLFRAMVRLYRDAAQGADPTPQSQLGTASPPQGGPSAATTVHAPETAVPVQGIAADACMPGQLPPGATTFQTVEAGREHAAQRKRYWAEMEARRAENLQPEACPHQKVGFVVCLFWLHEEAKRVAKPTHDEGSEPA